MALAVADFDRDGDLDLAMVGTSTSTGAQVLTVLTNRGKGTFAAPQQFATDTIARAFAVGDFNRDRKVDVAIAGFTERVTSFLLS